MLLRVTTLLASLVLLTSGFAPAQSIERHRTYGLLARLSYTSTYFVDWRDQDTSPQVCFALYQDRHYRVTRMKEHGTESLQGTLSREQVVRLTKMLESLDFQTSEGGLVRQASASLRAELLLGDKTLQYSWVNPDHQHPFPNSAATIVDWLQAFKAQDAFPFTLRELSAHPICPVASQKPLRPITNIP